MRLHRPATVVAWRAMLAVVAGVVLTVAWASLPVSSHATGLMRGLAEVIRQVAPQGWGFFTKDPRSPHVLAYVRDADGEWVQSTRGPNLHPKNAFGFNRASRLDEYDHAQLASSADFDPLWTDCDGGDLDRCAELSLLQNDAQQWEVVGYDLRLCGDVLLVEEEPTPLAFASLEFDSQNRAIVASVICHQVSE